MPFENSQIITSDHKSRNAQVGSYDFFLLYSQQNYANALLVRVTYYLKRFDGFQYAHMFYLNQSEV